VLAVLAVLRVLGECYVWLLFGLICLIAGILPLVVLTYALGL
jgi:hypothetical protein